MQDSDSDPTPKAIEALVANHQQFLSFLERRLRNPADAEEILQLAFVKGVEKIGAIRSDESAVAWFYRVLRNAISDHARRREFESRALKQRAADFVDSAQIPPDWEPAIC